MIKTTYYCYNSYCKEEVDTCSFTIENCENKMMWLEIICWNTCKLAVIQFESVEWVSAIK